MPAIQLEQPLQLISLNVSPMTIGFLHYLLGKVPRSILAATNHRRYDSSHLAKEKQALASRLASSRLRLYLVRFVKTVKDRKFSRPFLASATQALCLEITVGHMYGIDQATVEIVYPMNHERLVELAGFIGTNYLLSLDEVYANLKNDPGLMAKNRKFESKILRRPGTDKSSTIIAVRGIHEVNLRNLDLAAEQQSQNTYKNNSNTDSDAMDIANKINAQNLDAGMKQSLQSMPSEDLRVHQHSSDSEHHAARANEAFQDLLASMSKLPLPSTSDDLSHDVAERNTVLQATRILQAQNLTSKRSMDAYTSLAQMFAALCL